jgi:hypothetical protein
VGHHCHYVVLRLAGALSIELHCYLGAAEAGVLQQGSHPLYHTSRAEAPRSLGAFSLRCAFSRGLPNVRVKSTRAAPGTGSLLSSYSDWILLEE